MAQWCVLRAHVEHHEALHHSATVAWTDSGMGRGRSASFSARPTTGRLITIKKQSKLIRNAPEEETAIARGVTDDPDTFEPTDEQFAQVKPRGGRPKLAHPKVAVTVRYDAEIIDRFRASGDGWQTRMNDALRDWLKTHLV